MSDVKDLLLRLSRASERSDPLVFAGRERIIAETLGRTDVLPPTGDWGNTVLIEGAPGVGKTALLREISRQAQAVGATTLVQPDVPQPDDIETIYAELAAGLVETPASVARTTQTTTKGISVGPAALRGSRQSGATVAPPRLASPHAVAALRGDKPWRPSDKAVVFVDEVQNVVPDSAAAGLLRALHTQQSIPVLMVCAGLSNSRAAMERAGVSRIGAANTFRLGRLPLAIAVDCVRRTLDIVRQQGLSGDDAATDRWSQRLASASDGWPRHLQNYLRACWLTLHGQQAPSLDTADLDAAISRGDEFRESYYFERVEFAKVPFEVLAALYHRISAGESLDTFDAVAVLGDAIDALPLRVRERVRTTFADDDACFEKLLGVGALSTDGRGRCVSPVPSFARFVLSQAQRSASA